MLCYIFDFIHTAHEDGRSVVRHGPFVSPRLRVSREQPCVTRQPCCCTVLPLRAELRAATLLSALD
jgi:hypothetical protein